MASLFVKTERGREMAMIQVRVPGRGRQTIRLGAAPKRVAERTLEKVEDLVACLRLNQSPDPTLLEWLAGLDDDVHDAIARVGLAEPRVGGTRTVTLGSFLDKYIAQRRGTVSDRTIELLVQTKDRLLGSIGGRALLAAIKPDHAADWRAKMLATGLSEASVRLHTRNAKSFFNNAVERELIPKNPFRLLPSAAIAADREHYVSVDDAELVIARLPTSQWQLLFGLARFGGLRIPSESHILEWDSVDLDAGRMTVYAPKTGATRTVPIAPRLRELLQTGYDARDPACPKVVVLSRNNIHRTLELAIEKAELERWPDLYQTLRRSCETDWSLEFSMHAAAAWTGHSVAVSAKHYLQVPQELYNRAAGLNRGSALQNALPHRHELKRTEAHSPKSGKTRRGTKAA